MVTAVSAQSVDATNYDGYLNIDCEMLGGHVAINQKSTVQITQTGDGKCDFLLPNLMLGDMSLGDISLNDVNVAESNGTTTYTKEETLMGLLDNAIQANVSLTGTVDAKGLATMNIPVNWVMDADNTIPINVTFSTNPTGTEYTGYLNINCDALGGPIAVNTKASVYIVDIADGECMFLLPNLALGDMSLGDISLEGVKVATESNVTTYTKAATQMGLLDGAINANVSLDGKVDANGLVVMNIPVNWVMDADNVIPIDVTFSTKPAGTEYDGFLSVAFEESAPMVENMGAAVYITETTGGLCNFLLPNLSLGEGFDLGDIALTDVTVKEIDGVKTYTHDGTDMVIDLMGTPINAKVTLNGTIDAEGNVDMLIPVVWIDANLPINVKFTTKPAGTEYKGTLTVAFEDSDPMVENMPASVFISEDGYGSCNFMLPNLSLGEGFDLGNIALSGVKVTEADGVKTYTHDGTDMVIDLMGTPINAKVSLNGTIDAEGNVDMLIPVVWVDANLPINVTFKSKAEAGIIAAEAAADVVIYGVEGAVKVAGVNGVVSVYSTAGAKVAEAIVDGEATIDAPRGIAIVATPARTAKVVVK